MRSRQADKTLLDKGFTLVELLVVIVILGILAAVVVFAVGGTTKDAAIKACLTERSTVEAAVEAYRSQSDSADPPGTGALVIPGAGATLRHTPTYWTVGGGGSVVRRTDGAAAHVDPGDCGPNT